MTYLVAGRTRFPTTGWISRPDALGVVTVRTPRGGTVQDMPDQRTPVAELLPEIATASSHCLRWRNGQHSWRTAGADAFTPTRYQVEPLDERSAKSYVTRQHYSGSFPAAVHRFGLFDTHRPDPDHTDRPGALAGVAVFGIPVQAAVLTRAFPTLTPYTESLELSRFVLDDACPGNSESWFLGQCFTGLLERDVRGVVSFADPVPRRAADGTIKAPGHCGVIYQATNFTYTGRGTARTLTLLSDGTVLNDRAAQKVRRQEQGHDYVQARLTALGAADLRPGEDPARWLAQALHTTGARRIRHRGAHRYLARLGASRRDRERIPLGLPGGFPYPKQPDVA